MPPTTLVVDFGAHSTGAAVVVGDQATLVRDPVSGAARWPSHLCIDGGLPYAGSAAQRLAISHPRRLVDAPRRALERDNPIPLGERDVSPATALSAFLGPIRAQAQRLVPGRLDRLTLTVPTYQAAGYQSAPYQSAVHGADRRRDLLVAAGEAAGFAEVELVGTAAAVALEAQGAHALPEGSLVLVCELGETWSTVLLRLQRHGADVLAEASSTCGRDLEALLRADLHAQSPEWLDYQFALPGEEGLRARAQVVEFVRELKHALSDGERTQVTGRLGADGPSYTLRREWLGRLAEPGLRWVGASSRSLLARVAAGWTGPSQHGSANQSRSPLAAPAVPATLDSIAAVVLAGGHARLHTAERVLAQELGRPVIRLDDPELAAVRGASRFVSLSRQRRIPADHPRWRVEPVSWDVPTGRARLERWIVGVGEEYRRGTAIGQVRTADDRVYELTAPDDGVLLRRRGTAGDVVGPTLIASTKRHASLLAGDPPDKRQELSGSGEWLLTPDRRALVECADSGRAVRLWSVPDAELLHEFRPELAGNGGTRGRVFVQPSGGLALVAWDRDGTFSVWDVRSGTCTSTFRDPTGPTSVLVNEREWRLSTEGEDSGSAGRYRRSVATLWDLATGQRLEKLTDGWQRRLAGYEHRSASDCLVEAALSPDGRLRAVPVLSNSGPTGVSVRIAASEQEVFRAEHAPSERVRAAFSADGQFLLASRESPQDSQVDVWEL